MVGLLALLACRWGPTPPADAPDVLIVTVDTLRADRVDLAALLPGGRVFTQATTPLPRTTPALASMLTGLDPHHHGSREVGTPIAADLPTLAGQLRAAGWRTAAVSAMKVAGPEQGLDRGFDTFEVMHDAGASAVARAAIERLGPRPTLLWVHLADPHFPYTAPGDTGPCAELAAWGEAEGRAAIFSDRDGRASAALADCRARYRAEVDRAGDGVRELVRALEGRGRPALVVVSADHGENQGEDGLFYEHGPSVDDASLRVPLAVRGPGVVEGTDDGVIALTDLMPTVLGFLGQPVPDVDGVDASARWRGAAPDPTERRLAESGSALHVRLFGSLVSGRRNRWCVNDPPFSLCHRRDAAPTLHRHDLDPGLERDVSAEHPEVRARLLAAAERWPPESARERTVRDARFKLVARPALDGGHTTTLEALDAPGIDVSAEHPDVALTLARALDAWDAPLPSAVDRGDRTVEALRALGYVE